MPATVAWAETSFSICVTGSRPPGTVPRASTGASWKSPFWSPGRGAVSTCSATAPCGVNSTACS